MKMKTTQSGSDPCEFPVWWMHMHMLSQTHFKACIICMHMYTHIQIEILERTFTAWGTTRFTKWSNAIVALCLFIVALQSHIAFLRCVTLNYRRQKDAPRFVYFHSLLTCQIWLHSQCHYCSTMQLRWWRESVWITWVCVPVYCPKCILNPGDRYGELLCSLVNADWFMCA